MSELEKALRVESILVEPALSEHIDLALNVFLTNPQGYYDHLAVLRENDKPDKDAQLVQKMGLWPIREAMESMDALDAGPRRPVSENDADEYLPQYIDRDIQLKIEAFGRAMLDEAFLCLGEDAEEEVEKYKQAKTKRQRHKGINWLSERLHDIKKAVPDAEAEDDDGNDDVEAYAYHPAELSPKFIGRWPDIKIRPTCLAQSILAAAFYHKAGDKMVHAGVVFTAREDGQVAMTELTLIMAELAEDKGIELTDRFEKFKEEYVERLRETAGRDAGFHAATLAHFHRDTWIQTDPNYESNVLMQPQISQKVEELHDLLRDMEPNAKGVEKILRNRNAMTHWYFVNFVEGLIENMPSVDLMEEFLLGVPEDTSKEELINFLTYEFHDPGVNEFHFHLNDQFTRLAKYAYKTSYEEYVAAMSEDTFLGYVFPDAKNDDISSCVARCKYDARYRRDRANDLSMFPLYVLLSMGVDYINQTGRNSFKRAHAVYEIGLPEYRIGAAVLSDLASMLGSNLPPSFWLTYWPSHITLAEHGDELKHNSQQNALIRQTADFINSSSSTYYPVSGILYDILEQGGSVVETED